MNKYYYAEYASIFDKREHKVTSTTVILRGKKHIISKLLHGTCVFFDYIIGCNYTDIFFNDDLLLVKNDCVDDLNGLFYRDNACSTGKVAPQVLAE